MCMHSFKEFLDALDTPGGHVLLLTILGLLGVVLIAAGFVEAGKFLVEALPIAFYAMRGTGKANGQGNPPNDK